MRDTGWNRLLPLIMLLAALMAAGCAAKTDPAAQAQGDPNLAPPAVIPDWYYSDTVDTAYVEKYVTMPRPKGVMIIDSRPYKPKHVQGYIPTSYSIPHTDLEKGKANLPDDKSTELIFYCEGYT